VNDSSVFMSLCTTPGERKKLRLLLESIRRFGGILRESEAWIFQAGEDKEWIEYPGDGRTRVIPLEVPAALGQYPFGSKVAACARAEAMAGDEIRSLIWIDPGCLVIAPPVLFLLEDGERSAVRPVHIRNVGLDAGAEPDEYWCAIFNSAGNEDVTSSVETFVEGIRIRSYFNTHAFSVRPSAGIMREWMVGFTGLVKDGEFQATSCADPLHRIFLHQAVFSVLIAGVSGMQGVRLLPPSYSYPYNLQDRVPEVRRAVLLNDLVSITYENKPLHPSHVNDIGIVEPLRSWLEEHAPVQT
jgi:hypothetical protein